MAGIISDLEGKSSGDGKPATKGDEKKADKHQRAYAIVGFILAIIIGYYFYAKNKATQAGGPNLVNPANSTGTVAGSNGGPTPDASGGGVSASTPDLTGITDVLGTLAGNQAAQATNDQANSDILAGLGSQLSDLGTRLNGINTSPVVNQVTNTTPNPGPAANMPAPAPPVSIPANSGTGSSGVKAATAQGAPFGYSTIFNNAGVTYYGVGNPSEQAAAQSAGYKIVTAQAAGVPGGSTKAHYAYKP